MNKPQNTEALADALQMAWNDWCADTGHVPDAFHLRGASVEVIAKFDGSSFVRNAASWLEARGFSVVKTPVTLDSAAADRLRQLANVMEYANLSREDRDILLAAADNISQADA